MLKKKKKKEQGGHILAPNMATNIGTTFQKKSDELAAKWPQLKRRASPEAALYRESTVLNGIKFKKAFQSRSHIKK